jgi:pyruvate/2-oxoglutarate dehydrogenase complex dihydrolipoamide dehydrogenase (E3) component
MKHFDALVLGTGQAAPALVAQLAKAGKRVAVVEKGHLGGTCVNDGCTPTKAYVASARRAYVAANSQEHGVSSGHIQVDLKTIKARKDKLVLESREGIEKMFADTKGVSLFRGHGRFIDAHTVEVGKHQIEAREIFINVGARPRIPRGFEGVNYLTNTDILALEEIPQHLIVVGGGYIGLEFSQMFKRFGSKVTVVEQAEHMLHHADEDVSVAIKEVIESSGVHLRFGATCLSGKTLEDGSVSVQLECAAGDKEVRGSHVLLAVGRVPNTDDLGLAAAKIAVDQRGYIEVNDQLQTSQPHIYALGDCNGKGGFTHTAYNDFQIVADRLFGEGKRSLKDRILAYAAYIDPPLAHVGMSAKEILEKGIKAKVASRPMSRIARAKEMGETQGFLKILVDSKTDLFLGATFLGTGADEYIHTILDLMYAKAPYTAMRDAMHIHPTVSELLPTMLESLEDLNQG